MTYIINLHKLKNNNYYKKPKFSQMDINIDENNRLFIEEYQENKKVREKYYECGLYETTYRQNKDGGIFVLLGGEDEKQYSKFLDYYCWSLKSRKWNKIKDIYLSAFKSILELDYEAIEDYSEENYIQRNMYHQTPLMLATILNDYKAVSLLLSESCQIDDFNMTALDYAKKYNADKKIINRLEERELF